MAKFCGKCGAEMPDDAKICGSCGNSFVEPVKRSNSLENVYIDPEKQAKYKKIGIIVCAGLAAVIALTILINVISGFVGYKGAVRKIVKAIKEYDITTIVNMSSEVLEYDPFVSDDYIELYFENCVESIVSEFESRFGAKYKVKYDIKDAYEMSERQIDSLLEDYYDMEYFNAGMIDKFMVVNVDLTAKKNGTEKTKNIQFIMLKEHGKWRVFNIK